MQNLQMFVIYFKINLTFLNGLLKTPPQAVLISTILLIKLAYLLRNYRSFIARLNIRSGLEYFLLTLQ